mmetsp:Transcript_27507/g.64530  ORF Transcript_27507/g.64530 Transcript_27507/m.64530 type:complete len:151 (+) Transcript_27507:197-649(+)
MSSVNKLALLLIVCATLFQSESFTSTPAKVRTWSHGPLQAGRRHFLDAALSTTAGVFIASIPTAAMAEEEAVKIEDDLAMPSEEEQKKAEADAAAAQAERLRRKAELQKAKSTPPGLKNSLAKEREKQQGLKMSKEERRDAMCEELGRGC